MPKLEFFFDFSSPWTYMAFTQIESLCKETGAELIWKPFYVAAVFRQANHEVAAKRAVPVPAKLDYYWTDMQRWAGRLGIRIGRPPVYGGGSKPLNSAKALRGAFVALDTGSSRTMQPQHSMPIGKTYEISPTRRFLPKSRPGSVWSPRRFQTAWMTTTRGRGCGRIPTNSSNAAASARRPSSSTRTSSTSATTGWISCARPCWRPADPKSLARLLHGIGVLPEQDAA